MKVYYRIALGAVITAAAVIFLKLLIGRNTIALFAPQGTIATQERNLIVTMTLIMLIIVVPTLITLFTIAWKYRAGNNNAKYDPDRKHGAWRELLLWIIPAVIVAALAVLTWRTAHALDPYQPITPPSGSGPSAQAVTIEVVALPWKWLFIYPAENIATVNFVQFPVNTPVHFELTADAPMSSFWIPQLGTQIYAMDAMETQMNTEANSIGEFTGKDTEINGAGYAGMTFIAKSSSQTDFDAWVTSVEQSPNVLDATTYTALAAPSQNNPQTVYSSVTDPNLFNSIMMKFMMPTSSMPANMPGMSM